MSNLTIEFRAKRAEFIGGMGYKVPKLNTNHLTPSERDMAWQTYSTARNAEVAARWIANSLGGRTPGVVFEDPAMNENVWTITPDKSGFMATVSITIPFTTKTMRGL